MTTNKPEVVAWYTPTTRDTLPVVALNDRSQRGEPLIRLSDYETLQAECDKLRKDAARYRHLRDRLTGPRFDNLFFLELYNAGAFDHPDDVDDAVDDAVREVEHDS